MNLSGEGKDSPFTPPYADTPMDAALTAKAREALRGRLGVALEKVRALDATVGVDEQDLLAKQHAKAELDAALRPFVDLCVAWSGGIMLGAEEADAGAYQRAMELVAENKLPEIRDALLSAPETWSPDEKGWVRLTADSAVPAGFLKMLVNGRSHGTLVLPLIFPEVFVSHESNVQRAGFSAILGNPPWDQPEVSEPEYWAQYDLRAVDARLQRDRDKVIAELKLNQIYVNGWTRLQKETESQAMMASVLYHFQSFAVDGKQTVGRPDIFKLFAERWAFLLAENGYAGLVVPSAFHANEGATGIRNLYLKELDIKYCYSFENKRKLFEIDSRLKFALLVASKNISKKEFHCAYYLQDDAWLFLDDRDDKSLKYTTEFVELTGGTHLTFVECRDSTHFELLKSIYSNSETTWAKFCESESISTAFGVELHRNREYAISAKELLNSPELWQKCQIEKWINLPVIEGKSINQYQDYWNTPISVIAPAEAALAKRHWKFSLPFYRFAFRKVASSTNERTFIVCLLPPGFICNDSLAAEISPSERKNNNSLLLVGLGNTFIFDWLARSKVGAAVNVFILNPLPLPSIEHIKEFVTHNVLRLVTNHIGFLNLWQEQLGNEWRESAAVGTYPVLAGEEARWEVRSAIDAVVAQAYGLSREQYAHVLSTFSHKSYPKAPSLCLAKFDELTSIGLEAFVRRYDPYWDVPLVEKLPIPVIELPRVAVSEGAASYEVKDMFGQTVQTDLFGNVVTKGKKSKRK